MKERIETLKQKFANIQDVIKASNLTEEELALANYSGTSSRMIGARASLLRELVADIFNLRLDGSKWIPNWKKRNEPKWAPYFNMDSDQHPSGVGFSLSFCDSWDSYSNCGSRFAFETEELSDLSVELYPEIYIQTLTK